LIVKKQCKNQTAHKNELMFFHNLKFKSTLHFKAKG